MENPNLHPLWDLWPEQVLLFLIEYGDIKKATATDKIVHGLINCTLVVFVAE